MNKKTIMILVIILGLIGLGYFFMSSKKGTSSTGSDLTSSTSSAPKSLKDLLGMTAAQKCTFSNKTDNMESSGTVYVAGGKMRGDFTSVVSGKTTSSHMIVDGTTNYTWMEGEKTGYKMTFDPSDVAAQPSVGSAGSAQSQAPDLSQQGNYSCSGWIAESSSFTPPDDVKFMSLSDLIPSAKPSTGTTGTDSTSQCSVCDSLSGDDKTQCKTALNCK